MKVRKEPRLVARNIKTEVRSETSNIRCKESSIDRVYSAIEEECCRGHCFVDNELDLPRIQKSDIEYNGNDIYTVRFRANIFEDFDIKKVVRYVNYRLLSGEHIIYERRTSYGIPYLDCVWVIQRNELLEDSKLDAFFSKRDLEGAYKNMANCSENWDRFFRSNCNGKTLIDVARFLGYSQENMMFLECSEDDRKMKVKIAKTFPNTIEFLKSDDTKGRIGSKRTALEYTKDLIAGWIGEDLLCRTLRKNGIRIELNGADKDRTIIPCQKVDTKPDIVLGFDGGEQRECELMMEHTGFPGEKGIIVLRHYKFNSLVERKCLFLDLDFKTGGYVIIDFRKGTPKARFVEHYDNWGGKPAYVISLNENGIKMRDHSLLIGELKKRLSLKKVKCENSPTTHFFENTQNDVSILDSVYKKVEKERLELSSDSRQNTNLSQEIEDDSLESDDASDSSSEEEVAAWENCHPELEGWV